MPHPHDLNDDHDDPCFGCKAKGSKTCSICDYNHKEPVLCRKCLESVNECMCAEIDSVERIERLSRPVHIPQIPIPNEIMQSANRIEFKALRIEEIAKTL